MGVGVTVGVFVAANVGVGVLVGVIVATGVPVGVAVGVGAGMADLQGIFPASSIDPLMER